MLKAVSASRGPSLSKNWEVSKAHKGAYSGGKVQLSADGSFVACLYDSDVSFLDVDEGIVTKRLRDKTSDGAEEEIVSFALHPNDREIVTASRSLLLRHWDIATGQCKRAIKAHEHRVLCMDYDGRGKIGRVACASTVIPAVLAGSGLCAGAGGGRRDEQKLCIRTGTLVATGSSDHTIKVWDVERGYCTHNFRGHTGIVSVVAFHPDPEQLVLVSGSEDASVRVWDLNKQKCIATLQAHLSYVTSVAFLSGGSGLVSGGRDRVLNVWDMGSNELLKTFPVFEEVEGLQVLPETGEFSGKFHGKSTSGGLLAVAGKNGVVRVFALDEQKLVTSGSDAKTPSKKKHKYKNTSVAATSPSATFPLIKLTCRCVMTQDNSSASHKAGYTALLLDPKHGGLIGVTSDHNMVILQPPAGGARRGEVGSKVGGSANPSTLVTSRQIVGYNDEVIDIKSVPAGVLSEGAEGSWVAVATNSPQVRLFELGSFSCRLLDGHTDTVLALDVAPDGRHLCTSSKDRTCLLWDLELGMPVVRWSGHADAVGAVAASRKPGLWSPTAANGGAFVVSGAADRTLQRWDVPCKALAVLEDRARESRGEAAAAMSGTLDDDAYNGEEGKEQTLTSQNVKTSSMKASAWRPPAPLLETARRSVRAHEKDINCVAVSPNDAVIASASQDRTVKLWRSRDLELIGVLKGHKRGVWKVEFSPVDRCVATCSGDRTVKLWSITDQSCLRTFQGHTASVLSVAFISAGAQLVSGGADGLLKVWTVRSDECEATLDAHTDKVWALTTARTPLPKRSQSSVETAMLGSEEAALEQEAGPNGGVVVVSGGADSVINLWKDVTAREEEKAIAEKETALLKEQELYNRLRAQDYGPAIGLALELKRPQRLWSVLRDAMTEGMGEKTPTRSDEATTEMSSRRLDQYVGSWTMETIAQCLAYCKDWNTNARKSVVVHALVGSILRCVSISSLKELPGCAELVRVLLPYSERHFQRLDRLLQSSYLVEHTLASMKMLVAAGDNFDSKNSGSDTSGLLDKRPMVRELKRLRDGQQRSAAGKQQEVMSVEGGTRRRGDSDVGSIDSGTSNDEMGPVIPTPISEMVDGRVVFNVRVGDRDSDESSDEGKSPTDNDVDMTDAALSMFVEHDKNDGEKGEVERRMADGGDEEGGKPKKKRRKRASGGDVRPLGLAVETESAETLGDGGVAMENDGEEGVVENDFKEEREEVNEAARAGGSKKKKKRRRKSASSVGDTVGVTTTVEDRGEAVDIG